MADAGHAGKSLTKQLMVAVESALNDRFGSHAGWAHNTLFISELTSQRHVLPAHLHPGYRWFPCTTADRTIRMVVHLCILGQNVLRSTEPRRSSVSGDFTLPL